MNKLGMLLLEAIEADNDETFIEVYDDLPRTCIDGMINLDRVAELFLEKLKSAAGSDAAMEELAQIDQDLGLE